EDLLAVPGKDAEAVLLALVRAQAEVAGEGVAGRGNPTNIKFHALSVAFDVLERRNRHPRHRCITRAQMREIPDLVGEERTARTAGLRPAVHARREHEVIQQQLAPAIEQIEQTRLLA